MPDVKVKLTAAGVELKPPSLGRRLHTPVILASIFLLAFATRTYRLYSFPYFPRGEPWLGSSPEGLYVDEADRYLKESQIIFERLSTYQPPLFMLFMKLSMRILGTPYAIRVPSALASSVVAVLVYLVSMRKFGSRGASVASALYFIAMFPAFIYNRMAFLENGVALFLLASFYCLLRYEGSRKGGWLYLGGVLAALGAMSKITGVVAPLFFLAYGLYRGFFREAFKAILLVLILSAVSFLGFAVLVGLDLSPLLALLTKASGGRQYMTWMVGRETSVWQFFVVNSMPSGHLMWWLGYLRLEYWYVFTYFTLAYLAVKEYERVSDVILLVVSFVGLCILLSWGLGSYYVTVLQPFLSVPVGYGVTRMLRMRPETAMLFTLFLYAPMVANFNITFLGEGVYPRYDLGLYLLRVLMVGAPLISLFYLSVKGRGSAEDLLSRMLVNGVIIGLFLGLLFVGSYLTPAFYPHYLTVAPP